MNDREKNVQKNAGENTAEILSEAFKEVFDEFTEQNNESEENKVKELSERKRKYLYIALSIIISIALWLSVVDVQNPDIVRVFRNVPLNVVNAEILDDANLKIMSSIPETVTVNVKGSRRSIIDLDTSEISAELDVSGCDEGENEIRVEVRVPDIVSIGSISPGIVIVDAQKIITREADISVVFEGALLDNHEAVCTGMSISSVNVTGVKSLVESVDHVNAAVDVTKLGEKQDQSDALLVPVDRDGTKVEGLTLSEKSVTVFAQINVTKKAELHVDTVGKTAEGIVFQSIDYPETIEIVLPEENVDSVKYIEAEPVDLSDISENTTVDLKLILPDYVSLSRNQSAPQAVVKVDKISDSKVSCDLSRAVITNLGENLKASFEDASVNISVSAVSGKTGGLTSDNIVLSADCSGLKEGIHKVKLSAELVNVPDKNAYTLTVPEAVIRITEADSQNDDDGGSPQDKEDN